ncbi:serine hydrolase domain-containing protein [Marinifilum flexuosum]|uniref:CubicO group peptidase (Beta-lactamase class C family) n=1 Tax=Marinifilum flexuosum TaxID=1117708 RepID=A0A419WGG6_9BACT|nr:serine hydrolase [Marinifilum flexuosum]RKD94568.1 CubicO group peptidase (beta-lactamase class C family) [Marinifilum flexuosum]
MRILIVVLIIFGFTGCKEKMDYSYRIPEDKGDGLMVSTLEKHAFDTIRFEQVNADICKGKYGNVHSVLLLHKNELLVEQYYNDWDENEMHFLASTTKSFSAILTGIAIEQGRINSEHEKMLNFFPEYSVLAADSLKQRVSIKHLLTNTSGFKWDEHALAVDDPQNMGVQMDKKEDWLKESLELPMDTMPGTRYVYSGPNNIIVGEIIRRATGQNVDEFANENLFEALGIKEYDWFFKNGVCDISGGLKLKVRDIAKYGLLHLNQGKWQGKQVVSSEWMGKIFEPYIEIKHPLYSCYQWRMIETEYGFNSWFIPGNGGQIINVVPELDLVIVINADNRRIPKDECIPLEYLVKALTELHPECKMN